MRARLTASLSASSDTMAMNSLVSIEEPFIHQYLSPEIAMKLAIQEAYRGIGFVSPNPLVGCVVLDSKNQFLAKGYHARVGEGHAEVIALKGLSDEQLQDATIYVTLEPCAHEGRTPSCAKMLAQKPIKKVIYGLIDPNPLVAGKGVQILREAGIEVEEFLGLNEELEMLCEHFLFNVRNQRPWVSLKIASSLDGIYAHQSGDSRWITDEVSREIGHILRASHDAVLVGSQTLLIDDPQLNIRIEGLKHKNSKVFVIDPRGIALKEAPRLKVSQVHSRENLFFITANDFKDIELEAQFNVIKARPLNTQVDPLNLNLDEVLTSLWTLGVRSLYVEGGGVTLSSFIQQKKAQRMYLFQAPIILGGKSGKSWSSQVSIEGMGDRISLVSLQTLKLHSDLFMTGKF